MSSTSTFLTWRFCDLRRYGDSFALEHVPKHTARNSGLPEAFLEDLREFAHGVAGEELDRYAVAAEGRFALGRRERAVRRLPPFAHAPLGT